MLRRLFQTIIFASLLLANLTFAGTCAEPDEVTLPDGASIKSEEMIQAHSDVTKYIAAADVFLKCLDEEERAGVEPLTLEQKKDYVSRYNLVVEKIHTLAQGFNEQLRVYKSTNTKEQLIIK